MREEARCKIDLLSQSDSSQKREIQLTDSKEKIGVLCDYLG